MEWADFVESEYFTKYLIAAWFLWYILTPLLTILLFFGLFIIVQPLNVQFDFFRDHWLVYIILLGSLALFCALVYCAWGFTVIDRRARREYETMRERELKVYIVRGNCND